MRNPAKPSGTIRRGNPCVVLVGNLSSNGSNAVFDELSERLESAGFPPTRYASERSFREDPKILQKADVLVATAGFKCTPELMSDMPRLRAAISVVSGTEGYDINAASKLRICIGNGHTAECYESMAEATVMLMLALLYDLHGTEDISRNGLLRPIIPKARMLKDKTIGLIGFGSIARAVAKRLEGWQVTLQAYTPRPSREPWPSSVSRTS